MGVVLDMTEKQELEQRIDELCARVIDLETKLNTVEITWDRDWETP